jgi:hypothetical protein
MRHRSSFCSTIRSLEALCGDFVLKQFPRVATVTELQSLHIDSHIAVFVCAHHSHCPEVDEAKEVGQRVKGIAFSFWCSCLSVLARRSSLSSCSARTATQASVPRMSSRRRTCASSPNICCCFIQTYPLSCKCRR